MERRISIKFPASIIFIIALVFITVISATNRNTTSDPRATLLVSESILKDGTIKLDGYGPETLARYGYTIHQKNGHYYYYFPIGTSLISLPFVAVANGIGLDMLNAEPAIQIIIAAITSILTFIFLFRIAALFLNTRNALTISTVFWFGTSFSSTTATALWSHNFATLSALVVIYASVRAAKLNTAQPWPLIAVLLFGAYLCRPTMAILAPFVLLFVFSYARAAAVKSSLLLGALLGIFVLFSLHEFGQLLPDYYLPKRLEGGAFVTALYGNMLSPARGLLVYSPFIAATWICLNYATKPWGLKRTWLLIGLAWPVAHWLMISRFPHWWAGYSYGPRFMTDVLPGLFLLTLYAWPTHVEALRAKVFAGILFVTCAFSIVVNTGQGLFNRYAALWNAEPDIDWNSGSLFDWSYPQFLANRKGHVDRIIRIEATRLRAISPGQIIGYDNSKALLYPGWGGAELSHRWSEGRFSRLVFKVSAPEPFTGLLKLHIGTLGAQKITLSLNGAAIYSGVIDAADTTIEVPFDKALLKEGTNTLALETPDARQPGGRDRRYLAVALKSLEIR